MSNDVGTTDALTYTQTLQHFDIHQFLSFVQFVFNQNHSLIFRKDNFFWTILSSSDEDAARNGHEGVEHMYLDILFPDVDELEHNKSIKKLVVMAVVVAALYQWKTLYLPLV